MSPRPWNLIAELTYRCPLRCPYCSNPTDYGEIRDGVDAATWTRVFREAAELGVVHVGLTGGEPSARRDLEEILRGAVDAGLYTHLVTAGLPLDNERLGELKRIGLRSLQLSVQDALEEESDRIAGTRSFARKVALGKHARSLGLPLTLNVVLHRHNLGRVRELIELARELDADRVELANSQYDGWALVNREALLPTREQIEEAGAIVREERERGDRPELLFVLPDYYADRPKPCMGGWGQRLIVVAPDGTALPCHASRGLPGLEFWKVGEHSLRACWEDAPGMNAFRGVDWMPEPCRSCSERDKDFGGCRCQAFRLTGNAAAADPACALAPDHEIIVRARESAETALRYRGDMP